LTAANSSSDCCRPVAGTCAAESAGIPQLPAPTASDAADARKKFQNRRRSSTRIRIFAALKLSRIHVKLAASVDASPNSALTPSLYVAPDIARAAGSPAAD